MKNKLFMTVSAVALSIVPVFGAEFPDGFDPNTSRLVGVGGRVSHQTLPSRSQTIFDFGSASMPVVHAKEASPKLLADFKAWRQKMWYTVVSGTEGWEDRGQYGYYYKSGMIVSGYIIGGIHEILGNKYEGPGYFKDGVFYKDTGE